MDICVGLPRGKRLVLSKYFSKHSLTLSWALLALPLLPVGRLAAQGVSPETAGREIILHPGDRVRLKIWREPDLSGDFDVDESGAAVFPKIGRVLVSRLPVDSLAALLVATYSTYLRDPAIEVRPLRRVDVLGAVRNPAVYYVDATLSLIDVVAMAGGVAPEGKAKQVDLWRGGKRQSVKLSPQSAIATSPVQSNDKLWIAERSWLSRNMALITAGITGSALVLAAVLN